MNQDELNTMAARAKWEHEREIQRDYCGDMWSTIVWLLAMAVICVISTMVIVNV